MRFKKKRALFVCLLLLLLLTPSLETFGQRRGTKARRRQVSAQPSGSQKTLKSLINELKAAGMRIGRAGGVSQPFFSVKGHVITINGEQVQVFEYAKVEKAEMEAKMVDATGSSVGTNMMTWMAPPHFYRRGRLIVLYVGSDSSVINTLTSVLGPQFAGR